MSKENTALQKAHSFGVHLGRMQKAIDSFHEHMSKAHSAHHADMKASMEKLHKMVGITPEEQKEYGGGNNEPVSTDLESAGTTNLQNFGTSGSSDAAKAAAATNLAKGREQPLTKAEVQEMLNGTMNTFLETFMKALVGGEERVNPPQQPNGSVIEPNYSNSPGIGDRRQMPVQRVVGGNAVNKAQDDGSITTQVTEVKMTPELAAKAMGGDRAALREFMKSAKPGDVPDTLVAPLAKIH